MFKYITKNLQNFKALSISWASEKNLENSLQNGPLHGMTPLIAYFKVEKLFHFLTDSHVLEWFGEFDSIEFQV